jgi:hypothetical protein
MTKTRLDGYELFALIGKHPDVFSEQRTAIDNAATSILSGRVKLKGFNLNEARRLRDAIGAEYFALLLDIMSDADLAKIVKKLDPHFVAAASADSIYIRHRIVGLASNQMELATKPEKSPKEKAPKKPSKAKGQPKNEAAWPTSVSAKPVRRASPSK